MKTLILPLATLAIFSLATFALPMQPAQADNVIQMNNNQDVVMTGTISDVSEHHITINDGTTSTQVSTDNLQGGSAAASDLLKNGMKVTVRGTLASGEFNEPMIRATNVSAYQDATPNAAAAAAIEPAAGGVTPGQPVSGAEPQFGTAEPQ
jgi:hypothetical protein